MDYDATNVWTMTPRMYLCPATSSPRRARRRRRSPALGVRRRRRATKRRAAGALRATIYFSFAFIYSVVVCDDVEGDDATRARRTNRIDRAFARARRGNRIESNRIESNARNEKRRLGGVDARTIVSFIDARACESACVNEREVARERSMGARAG